MHYIETSTCQVRALHWNDIVDWVCVWRHHGSLKERRESHILLVWVKLYWKAADIHDFHVFNAILQKTDMH